MSFLKNILKSAPVGVIASGAIGGYIRLVDATTRWSMDGREHLQSLEQREGGFILAFWHARLLMAPVVRRETTRKVHMLVSNHRDGEIITRAVGGYGVEFIRGSAANPKKTFKEKSGASAVAQMTTALDAGGVIGITPDGPRGPRQKAQMGVLRLAAITGAPILPGAYATSRGVLLGTWDRFLLAGPLSRGVFVAGAPIPPPAHQDAATMQASQRALEAALNIVTNRADTLVGRGATPAISPE